MNYVNWLDSEPVDGLLIIGSMLGLWKTKAPEYFQMTNIKDATDKLFLKDSESPFQAKKSASTGELREIRLPMSSEAFEVNPMVVEEISETAMRSCQVDNPSKCLCHFRIPFLVMLAEKDEIMKTDLVSDLVPKDKLAIFHGATHLGMLLQDQFFQTLWDFIEGNIGREVPSESKILDPKNFPLGSFKFMDSSGDMREDLITEPRSHQQTLLQMSCHHAKPEAVIIFLLPKSCPEIGDQVLDKYSWRFIKVTPCGFHELDRSRRTYGFHLYSEIERVARLVRYNCPGTPVFLAGQGFGASLALNYAGWAEQSFVNGYILLSPIPDPSRTSNNKFVQAALKRAYSVKKTFRDWIKVFLSCGMRAWTRFNKQSFRESTGLLPGSWEDSIIPSLLVTNLVESIRAINSPFIIVFPENDDEIDVRRLLPELSKYSQPPFQIVQVIGGATRQSLYAQSKEMVRDWILRTAVSPRAFEYITLPAYLNIQAFEPISLIGKGTYGQVWLALHRETKRHFAIKIQDKARFIKPTMIKQAVREVKVLSMLKTPFAPRFMAAFQDEGRLYIVTEYIVGGEMLKRLQDAGRLANDEAKFYASEILLALEYLHSNGIAYRDLKPENVLLDTLGHIRLVDFGYARIVEDDGRCASFCGSPYYLAPELLSKGFYNGKKADIWGLGVMIYEMLVGKPPFLGKSMKSVYARILTDEPRFPSCIEPDAADLIIQMLNKDPSHRIGSLDIVKKHRWFKNIDWDMVATRSVLPPFQPAYAGDNDTSNYGSFDEDPSGFYSPESYDPDLVNKIPSDSTYEGY